MQDPLNPTQKAVKEAITSASHDRAPNFMMDDKMAAEMDAAIAEQRSNTIGAVRGA